MDRFKELDGVVRQGWDKIQNEAFWQQALGGEIDPSFSVTQARIREEP